MRYNLQATTPVHNHLWHKGFVLLSLAGVMLASSSYIMLAFYPLHLYDGALHRIDADVAVLYSMAAYGVGLYAFGPVVNWLIQRYRRGSVCFYTILMYLLCLVVTFLLLRSQQKVHPAAFAVLRFFTAAYYGLASMILYGTLIIDKSESWLRTRANHSIAWLVRLCMVVAPLSVMALFHNVRTEYLCLTSCALALMSAVFVRVMHIPFKSPDEDIRMFSLDRFLMPTAFILFASTFCVFAVYGIILSQVTSVTFYLSVLFGFLWALVSERWPAFCGYENRDLLIAAVFVAMGVSMFSVSEAELYRFLAVGMSGAGLGMFGAKAQLAFVGRSRHCQRGTAVVSFFLACESGVALGMACGSVLFGLK